MNWKKIKPKLKFAGGVLDHTMSYLYIFTAPVSAFAIGYEAGVNKGLPLIHILLFIVLWGVVSYELYQNKERQESREALKWAYEGFVRMVCGCEKCVREAREMFPKTFASKDRYRKERSETHPTDSGNLRH